MHGDHCSRPGSSGARHSATWPSSPRARRPSTSEARTASTTPARSSRDDVAEQSSRALDNAAIALEAAGASLADVVQWTVLLAADADLGAAYGAIAPRLAGPGAPPLVTAARGRGSACPGP